MNVPILFPEILLPADSVPMDTWPVIACDQFTADESYWRQVEDLVGSRPSTLRLILPEIYLERADQPHREAAVRAEMRRYLDDGVFQVEPHTAVFVRRRLQDGTVRRGVVVAVDLEEYEFDPAQQSIIRASEETIPERLPPRAAIREQAPIESPHVLVLYDDREDAIIQHIEAERDSLRCLYDTPLMLGGGSIEGYAIPEHSTVAADLLSGLSALPTYTDYGYLLATGDGNHSLAAAKTVWTKKKAAGAALDDPFRYCLVELVNVYDDGLPFHPIHRLVEGDETAILDSFLHNSDARFHGFQRSDLIDHLNRETLSANEIALIGPAHAGLLSLPGDTALAVAVAEDAITRARPDSVDYIHGLAEVVSAAEERGAVAIILPELDRSSLFPTVAKKGTLPRKAFSLGEARDKRYYLECRQLSAR